MKFIQQSKRILCQTTIALAVAIAGLQANAAETLEIHVTKNDGKVYILSVDRDESSLSFNNFDLTSLILPAGLSNLQYLSISGNSLTNLTLPKGLWNLTSLDFVYNGASLTLPE